jgi:hypothetical protein
VLGLAVFVLLYQFKMCLNVWILLYGGGSGLDRGKLNLKWGLKEGQSLDGNRGKEAKI